MTATRTILLAAAIVLVASEAAVIAQPAVLVSPGRSVGPVRLGMTTTQVLRVLGRPTSRVGEALWTYDRPIQLRVEFAKTKVKSIYTWDPRARTPQGLTIGAPYLLVVRGLGGTPEITPAPPGTWLYNRAMGLAVYVQGGFAAAFVVVAVTAAPVPGAPTPAPPTPVPPIPAPPRPPTP